MNAQQYMLSGCVVLHKDINMVIVQGGRQGWMGLNVKLSHVSVLIIDTWLRC